GGGAPPDGGASPTVAAPVACVGRGRRETARSARRGAGRGHELAGDVAAARRSGEKARRLPRWLLAPRRGTPARDRPQRARTSPWLRSSPSFLAGAAVQAARRAARLSAEAATRGRPSDASAAAQRVAAPPRHAGSAAARSPRPLPRRLRARLALAQAGHP